MATNHFNQLTEAEQERLSILIEECGEVIQAACKILRHGYESVNPTVEDSETNRTSLTRELGDLQYAILQMEEEDDVSTREIIERRAIKAQRIAPYLHHQPSP